MAQAAAAMVAWVPAVDKGDGSRWEVDDDKRGPHGSGAVRERRWAERDQEGAMCHFARSIHAGAVSWLATSFKVTQN